jgi:glycosyltransferase involved in cell wall biosynthesis
MVFYHTNSFAVNHSGFVNKVQPSPHSFAHKWHEFRDDVVKFLYVSPLFPYKNHEMVLEAFNIIVSMGLNVEITFIGAGDKKNTYAFKKLINKSIKMFCP